MSLSLRTRYQDLIRETRKGRKSDDLRADAQALSIADPNCSWSRIQSSFASSAIEHSAES